MPTTSSLKMFRPTDSVMGFLLSKILFLLRLGLPSPAYAPCRTWQAFPCEYQRIANRANPPIPATPAYGPRNLECDGMSPLSRQSHKLGSRPEPPQLRPERPRPVRYCLFAYSCADRTKSRLQYP